MAALYVAGDVASTDARVQWPDVAGSESERA